MKSLGIFFTLAFTYLVSVLAGPPPPVYIEDKNYEYYAQEGFTSCYVTKLTSRANRLSKLTFEPSVTKNGVKYYVGGLMADLSKSRASTIEIPSTLESHFSISENVLKTAKNLKELKVESYYDVYTYENTFTGVNTDINISGRGVDRMAINYYTNYLKDNYPDLIQDYHNLSEYDTRINLYNIAKIIKNNFVFDTNMAHGDNGAVALFLKRGNTIGLNRVARYLAIASGFSQNNIVVAGDDIQHGFCLVKLNKVWYVFDAVKGSFNDREPWSFFQTMDGYIKRTLNPYYGRLYQADVNTFVKYNSKYGYSNECYPEKQNLMKWLPLNDYYTLA